MKGRRLRRLAAAGAMSALGGLALGAVPALGASSVTYTPSSFGSQLSVTGEANDDQIEISLEGPNVVIRDNGTGGITTSDVDCGGAPVTPRIVQCPFDPPDPAPPAEPTGPVSFGLVNLANANDSATNSAPFIVSLQGGGGDDTLTGGPDDDSLNGGLQNDSLFGGDGGDSLNGGGESFSTGGTDLLDGQGGIDRAVFFRELPVNVTLNNQADDGFPGEGDNAIAENVSGGTEDDVLVGDNTANILNGGDGNDLLVGLGGSDILGASSGDDGLIGGEQRDRLECDSNFDTGIVEPRDMVGADCERTGAQPVDGTASVDRKRRTRVVVSCPAEEANQCDGTVVVLANQTQIGAGAFSLAAGATGRVPVRLSKQGAGILAAGGGTLLANVQAHTSEPIGTSVHQEGVLLRARRTGGGK